MKETIQLGESRPCGCLDDAGSAGGGTEEGVAVELNDGSTYWATISMNAAAASNDEEKDEQLRGMQLETDRRALASARKQV